MEDQITQNEVAQQGPPQASDFQSSSNRAKNSNSKWLIIFILLLVLGGAGIYFFSKTSSEPIATPTPSFGIVPIDEPQNTPSPTSTPAPVNKSEVSIEILNGTGITGEAKLLSDKLKTLGYSDITSGNADSTNNTITTVTFLSSLSKTVQDELKKELESFYKEVNVKTSTTQKSDVVVITGLRGSQTSKPASTATPQASGTPKPSATPTSTPL
ncbi:MAG: LytR C-terminal domain-containing protein [bacterium]|nr:MAG: LytR C-terminal domain-containing protein [bacterium]